jgi:hypothetical protein
MEVGMNTHDPFEETLRRAKEQARQHEESSVEEQLARFKFYWHGEPTGRGLERWLVHQVIPETGIGLAPGPWGSGKTFGVLDLAGSVMTATPFAGYPVNRRGGVLFIAAEGGAIIEKRLKGLVEYKLKGAAGPFGRAVADDAPPEPSIDLDHLPFVWIERSPRLREPTSYKLLSAIVRYAAEQLKERFGVDLVLIVIDTFTKATELEDAMSTSENQRVCNGLADISNESGAFVLAVDHFGKDNERGTRGPVVKEDSSEVVLAFLCNRTLSGAVSNTRMALRKVKDSEEQGKTIPFELNQVKLDDCDPITGKQITTCIIEWQLSHAARDKASSQKLSKEVKVLVAALQRCCARTKVTKSTPRGSAKWRRWPRAICATSS